MEEYAGKSVAADPDSRAFLLASRLVARWRARFPPPADPTLDAEFGQHWWTGARRGIARQPLATIEQIRRTIGEYNFAGQYQQARRRRAAAMAKAGITPKERP